MYMWPVTSLKLDDGWLPKSIICLRDYSFDKFLKLRRRNYCWTGGLPLADGLRYRIGTHTSGRLYCAVVTGFPDFRSRRVETQIGGPTGAFVVGSGNHLRHGIDGLYMCTLMAG